MARVDMTTSGAGRLVRAAPLTAEIVTSGEIDTGAWEKLGVTSSFSNVFHGPDCVAAIRAELDLEDRVLRVAEVGSGQLVAVLPLTRLRPGLALSAVSLLSHPYGPAGTPLVAPGRETEAWAAALDALAAAGHHALHLPDLVADGAVAAGLLAAVAERGSKVVELDRWTRAVAVADASWAGVRRPATLAKQKRRLAERGTVGFAVARGADVLGPAFDAFLTLERSGWKGRAGTAIAASPRTEAFVRDLVGRLAARDAVELHALTLDGRPIAAALVLGAGRERAGWKIAHDETFAAYSPGRLLVQHVADAVRPREGTVTLDPLSGPGVASLVDGVWAGRREMVSLIVELSPGAVGFRALRLDAALRRTLRDLKRRLKRR